ncbi:MAG TPA: DsbE family thiol:disulfide interchange protein [Moraxellaceae bacterium]|nr:DsbE family thiol:disulfide interchange protein [Moraxellaceae bacterium]
MNKSTRIALFALPLIGFIALAVLLGSRLGTDPSLLPSARVGQPMPSFTLRALQEPQKTLTAASFKGQVAILNVWATWCISCQVEHPVLMDLSRQGIPIYGVNYKDEREAAVKYLELHGDPFSVVVSDDKGDLGLDLGVYGAPETYLIDRDGNIRYRLVGVLDPDKWAKDLKPRYDALRAGRPLPPDGGA